MAADDLTAATFVGVDSGGTRTNVQIVELDDDPEAPTETSYEVPSTLSGALPEKLVPTTLRHILAPLEMQAGEGSGLSPVHLWISAAGFTQWTRDRYVAALDELAPDLLGGRIGAVGVANDAVSLLLGLRADGSVIAGTGSNVIVRGPNDELYQSGGHEWVACDYGSGFWIGLHAIRKAYRDLENGIQSVLLQRMHEHYGIRASDNRGLIHKLRDLAVGDENIKKEVAGFAAAVCRASERGDKAAQNIVKSEAENLADVTAEALRRTVPRDQLEAGIKMVQCGSLIDNTFYRTSFEAQLEMRLLSGSDQMAQIEWQRVITGVDAAISLAKELMVDPERYLSLDDAFRPAIVQR